MAVSATLTSVGSRKGRGSTLPPLEEPWASLREAYLALRGWRAGLLSGLNLSFSEYVAMELCSRAPVRASDIAEAIGVTAAGATDLIDRLEARHLVQRTSDSTDRRVVLVDLTRTGERLFREAQLSQRAMLRRLTGAMTDEERRALLEGLSALTRAVRREAG